MLIPGFLFAAFTVAAGVIGAGGPRITDSAADVAAYYTGHHALAIGWGVIVFASAIPLTIWAATVYRRLRQLGITAPGAAIGLSGGLLAAASLAVSGLAIWTAAQTSVASQSGVAAALNALSFAAGGAGFAVPLGLMIAGVCVPSLFVRLLPRALAWFGLIVAVLSELATLTLLFGQLGPLLPISRFGGGVIWLLAASVLLPHQRRHRESTAASAKSESLIEEAVHP